MNDWKPGDVAIGTGKVFKGRQLVRLYDGDWMDLDGELLEGFVGARLLVVIDPEDAEQVARLDAAYSAAMDSSPPYHTLTEVMQTALREFANPNPTPRIEEPTGLGAVVEDAEGRRFVLRCDCNNDEARNWWPSQANDRFKGVVWADIKAVRVLSHGVTEDS